MGRHAKVWDVREDYRPILFKVKELFPTVLKHIEPKRVFLCGFTNRSSNFIARISSNRYPWSLIIPHFDYVITFWTTRFDAETVAFQHYVVLHELFHIPASGFEEGQRKEYRRLVHHDIEDFSNLLRSYGIQMESVDDVMKGERKLFREEKGPHRFPRTAQIK